MRNFIQNDIAMATELIATGVGFAILLWAYRNEGKGVETAKFVGGIIFAIGMFIFLLTALAPFQKPMQDNNQHYRSMPRKHFQRPPMNKKQTKSNTRAEAPQPPAPDNKNAASIDDAAKETVTVVDEKSNNAAKETVAVDVEKTTT